MDLFKVVVPVLVSAGFATTAYAQAAAPVGPAVAQAPAGALDPSAPQQVDISGLYASTFGAMTLIQTGVHVTGSYAYHSGKIDGTIEGNTLRFTWSEDDGVGRGELVLASDGELIGAWGSGTDDRSGGAWRATPRKLALGALALAGARGPDLFPGAPAVGAGATPAPDASDAPHAGAWSFEMTIPIDATFASSTVIGVGGLGLGLGKRLTDAWYLGGTAELEGLVATGDLDGAPLLRLRGGAEARYIFHQGTGTASVNDGPAFEVPRYDWIGARAGLESLDGGTTRGGYADLSLGTDMWIGSTQLGIYLSAGIAIEPLHAYGTPSTTGDPTFRTGPTGGGNAIDGGATAAPATDDSSLTTATYLTFGWRIAFG
ncbi:MAG TPA: hypothetical protein VH165_11170 [Kofleriaceae bacterium]|jgi:hypothetical protein|nr:hypothetical protein [Kofleriaceae bacterium]